MFLSGVQRVVLLVGGWSLGVGDLPQGRRWDRAGEHLGALPAPSRACAHGYLRILRAGIRFAHTCAAGVIEVMAAVADPVAPAGLRVAVPMA